MNGLPRIAWLVPSALAAGTLAMAFEATHPPAFARAGMAQPLPVATAWHAFGAELLITLALALALAGWAYLRTLAQLPGSGDASPTGLVWVVAIALTAAAAAPVVFSSDAYAYAAYGEMLRVGLNPYGHALLPHADGLFRAAIWQWGNPPPTCAYGPLFVGIAATTVTALAPLGTLAQLSALRLSASLALIAVAALAYRVYPGDRCARLRAAATVALNPVAIWCAAEGHNDALALAVGLAGIALVRRGGSLVGGLVAALAGIVKLPGMLAAIACATDRRARLGAAIGVFVVLATAVPMLVATSIHAGSGGYAPQASLQGLVLGLLGPRGIPLGIGLAVAAAGALATWALRTLRRGDAAGWPLLAIAGWVLIPNPYPWYGLWMLAVAALAPRSRAASALIGLTFTQLLRYAPDVIGPLPAGTQLGVAALTLLPLLLLAPRLCYNGTLP